MMEAGSIDFSWEVLAFDDCAYDFRWEVLRFTISTSHFMVCFEGLPKNTLISCCVLRAAGGKYCKLRGQYFGISDSMA